MEQKERWDSFPYIYFYENGKEISVNPYEVLLFLENKKLIYSYF